MVLADGNRGIRTGLRQCVLHRRPRCGDYLLPVVEVFTKKGQGHMYVRYICRPAVLLHASSLKPPKCHEPSRKAKKTKAMDKWYLFTVGLGRETLCNIMADVL